MLLSLLLSLPVMAAPLNNEQFTTIPVLDFTGVADGTDAKTQGGWIFYGETTTTAKVQGEQFVISQIDPTLPYIARFALPAKITADQAKDAKFMGYYVENNTANPIGVNVMAESFGGGQNEEGKDFEHQMMYTEVYPEDIVCYLVDMDGNVTTPGAYQVDDDDNAQGLAEVPAGFKGYYLVSLEEGGFNTCLYGSWGYHPDYDCEGGAWKSGEYGLVNMGLGFQGEIAEGETVVFDDLFMAGTTDKFTDPNSSSNLTTPTAEATETSAATAAVTAAATASAASTAKTDTKADTTWIYYAIAAVVVVGAAAAVILIIKNKKNKAE